MARDLLILVEEPAEAVVPSDLVDSVGERRGSGCEGAA
jgi:hypothetical protein